MWITTRGYGFVEKEALRVFVPELGMVIRADLTTERPPADAQEVVVSIESEDGWCRISLRTK